jgi:hypothetical protein
MPMTSLVGLSMGPERTEVTYTEMFFNDVFFFYIFFRVKKVTLHLPRLVTGYAIPMLWSVIEETVGLIINDIKEIKKRGGQTFDGEQRRVILEMPMTS